MGNHLITLVPTEKMTFTLAPELPKYKVKREKITCEVTALRWLSEYGRLAFESILGTACTTENCTEVSFNVTGMPKDKVDLICEIVTAVSFECRKGGKNPFVVGGRFIQSVSFEQTDKRDFITFKLSADLEKDLFDLAHSGKDNIDLADVAIFHCQKEIERLTERNK